LAWPDSERRRPAHRGRQGHTDGHERHGARQSDDSLDDKQNTIRRIVLGRTLFINFGYNVRYTTQTNDEDLLPECACGAPPALAVGIPVTGLLANSQTPMQSSAEVAYIGRVYGAYSISLALLWIGGTAYSRYVEALRPKPQTTDCRN
jgi:hypothetical protein